MYVSPSVLFLPNNISFRKWPSFEHVRWVQNLHKSTWNHGMLFTDISSNVEQLLTRSFFVNHQKYEPGGRLDVIIDILLYFMESTHEQLQLDK